MKSAIAAFVAAVSNLPQDLPGSLSFLITGDEEGVAEDGTVRVVQALAAEGEVIDHCIVGEPTSANLLGDMVKIGRRGSINAWIAVDGKQGHVAYPHRAANPIPVMVDILSRLQSRVLDEGYTGFQPSNLEVTTVDVGNTATNVIPASAKARINIRFNPAHKGKDLAGLDRARVPRGRRGLLGPGRGAVQDQRRGLPDRAGRLHRRDRRRRRRRHRPRARAVDHRRHQRRAVHPRPVSRWSSSAWSARPCTRSTSGFRCRRSATWPASTRPDRPLFRGLRLMGRAALASWPFWALASAVFAALTAILAKVGIDGVGSNLATFIRTVVILGFAGLILTVAGEWRAPGSIAPRSWLFLVLSGLATGASWLCYFRALKLGEAAKVAPVDKLSVVFVAIIAATFLGEKLSPLNWLGVALIAAGAVLVAVRV
jgi:uncharacterized membrane protein